MRSRTSPDQGVGAVAHLLSHAADLRARGAQESREQAMDRMVAQATQMGANAIVNVRFSTSSVAQGAAELYAYGTAVKVQ